MSLTSDLQRPQSGLQHRADGQEVSDKHERVQSEGDEVTGHRSQ